MSILKIDIPTANFEKFGKLPGKPSELILLALNDLRVSEKAGFKVDMSDWLVASASNGKNKFCTVCFAGAVMAQTLGKTKESKEVLKHKGKPFTSKDKNNTYPDRTDGDGNNIGNVCKVSPGDFSKERSALSALNYFREGEIENGFTELDLEFPADLLEDTVNVTQYEEDKAAFKARMLEIASDLARIGY